MKLTAFTDYSLRVLMFLAADPVRRATIAEVATAFGVSESHLTKVVYFLGRRGWIATYRGKGGGMGLARPAHEIVLGQVVRDTEGESALVECFQADGGHCAMRSCCTLKGVLDEAARAYYAVLDRRTLADVTPSPRALAHVLHLQRAPVQAGRLPAGG